MLDASNSHIDPGGRTQADSGDGAAGAAASGTLESPPAVAIPADLRRVAGARSTRCFVLRCMQSTSTLFFWEICQNNAYPGIVFCFNARKNAYFIVTPQRTNRILFEVTNDIRILYRDLRCLGTPYVPCHGIVDV